MASAAAGDGNEEAEGVGMVVETYAQLVVIETEKTKKRVEASLFALFPHVQGERRDVFSLAETDQFPCGSRVTYRLAPSTSSPSPFGVPVLLRPSSLVVVALQRLPEPLNPRLELECRIEEHFGIIDKILNDDTGVVKTERDGSVNFTMKAVVPDSEMANDDQYRYMSLHKLLPPQRVVCVRTYMGGQCNADFLVASIEPLGKIYSGEGVITEVKEKYAIIRSFAFGEIFMSRFVFRTPRDVPRDQAFRDSYALKVRFQIGHNIPGRSSKWRAIRVDYL